MSEESHGSASSGSSGSLATALQLEIKRRKQKAASAGATATSAAAAAAPTAGAAASPATKKAPFITDKNEKHDMLIAEFKKAHRKMFTSSTEASEEDASAGPVKNVKAVKEASSPAGGSEPETRPKAPPPPPVRTTPTSAPSCDPAPAAAAAPPPQPRDPGIPTPDYDSTPAASPAPSSRKLFTKHSGGGRRESKHITPPTVEGIQRAKSLTALHQLGDKEASTTTTSSRSSAKSRAPAPGSSSLRAADSMTDLRVSPPRPRDPPPSAPKVSSFQPEFFKRHPELDMEGELARPASSSYLDSRSSPSVSLSLGSHQSQSEPRRFEFLPKPCDPAKLPAKQSGEEARIASKDYRGSINSNKIYNIGELPPQSKSKVGKTDNKIIRELSEKTARSFGLKKAPAPMPPVLRK